MADYPVHPHNAGGTDIIPASGGSLMQHQQSQQSQMAHQPHQQMMGQQIQGQMINMPMRGAPGQTYSHGMPANSGMIQTRQAPPGSFRPQMMRQSMDQQRFTYVNPDHVHHMGIIHPGGTSQQTGHMPVNQQSSQVHQQQPQQQVMSSHHMMNHQMPPPQMVGMPMKMNPGHGAVVVNQGMMSNPSAIHQRHPSSVQFRQPLIRQPDPRMTYMTPEQMQQMDRVRMQGMVQQHHIQGGQPRTMHPPQLPTSSAHPTPSSSALRQALGYPTPPVVSSSLSQPNIPQQPQNAQVSVTHPGGSSSGNSNQFFGEQTRNAGNHLENEPQASSSNAGEYRSVGEVVHVNPKLVNEPILSREALDRVVKSVDPHETLEDDVAEAICVMMDEFINDVIGQASRVARHRGGTRLEGRDVSYALEHFFDMPMSADDFYSGSQPASARNRSVTNDAHQQRMALIKKTLKKP